MSVNRAIIVGYIGRDPEIRTTQAGKKIAAFAVATSERRRNRETGERTEETQWHNIVVLNEKLAEVAAQYAKKGSQVCVIGTIKTRRYKGKKDNIERSITEIVLDSFGADLHLLDRKERDDAPPYDPDARAQEQPATPDEEIPF